MTNLHHWWWYFIASFFHSIILQQYILTDLNNEIQYKGCRKLIDYENQLFNSFLSYKEMREEKKNLCMGGKISWVWRWLHQLLWKTWFVSFSSFFFSSPLHSKVPSYKDKYKVWLQPFRLFGPWWNLQINKL